MVSDQFERAARARASWKTYDNDDVDVTLGILTHGCGIER